MNIKVALVHDDLMQWGGAEKVLVGLSEIFPDAPIYTSVFNHQNKLLKQKFKDKIIHTSFIQKIPLWQNMYKALLPFYPIAFEQFDFSEYDLVISQTTRFAKSVITKPHTTHICYCHTPPRFLWNFSGEKTSGLLNMFLTKMRLFDQVSANRVDKFLAGSENAKSRIQKIYKGDSVVIYPFVDLDEFSGIESFDGGYYLLIARLTGYKRVDLAIEAFNKLGLNLKIVGAGPKLNELRKQAGPNIEFFQSVPDVLLKQLLAGCKGLIVTAEEDFGLTSLEAQALGKGVIAYGAGGSLETVIENKAGVFFNEQTANSLEDGIKRFEKMKINPEVAKENASRFSKDRFRLEFEKVVKSL